MPQVLTQSQMKIKLAVEAQSNGLHTAIFTSSGNVSIMYKLAKFDMAEVNPSWSGTHPAFIVDGVEKDFIYIGVYSGYVIGSGPTAEIVSQASTAPTTPALGDVDQKKYIANCGQGFHMMTNDEWAAVALMCRKKSLFPFGRNNGGSASFGYTGPTGRPVNTDPFIYSGSGPSVFRHNLQYNGISDMVGNVHERVTGARLINGELHLIDPSLTKNSSNDLSKQSNLWKAVNATTGDLIDRTFTGTIADSTYTPTTQNSVRFGLNPSSNTIGLYAENSGFAVEILKYSQLGQACITKLQQLGILSTIQYADPASYGKYWNNIGIRASSDYQFIPGTFSTYNMMRGGSINSPDYGIDSYTFDFPDDMVNNSVSCRPCYYE